MTRPLRIGFWNINGYSSSILGNKLGTDDFMDVINKHDIFAIVETLATHDAKLSIRNFEHFIKCRDKSGKRAFGGLSVYISRKLSEGVSYVPTENKNAIWCKLDRTYFNLQNDIYIGTVYLSPSNFERSNSVDLIGELEVEMLLFSQKGDVVVQGDFNARTGDMQETILEDDNAFLNVPEDYEVDELYIRQSQDSGTINSRGRSLLKTCTALNLRILNGRIVGDLDGKKTCASTTMVAALLITS